MSASSSSSSNTTLTIEDDRTNIITLKKLHVDTLNKSGSIPTNVKKLTSIAGIYGYNLENIEHLISEDGKLDKMTLIVSQINMLFVIIQNVIEAKINKLILEEREGMLQELEMIKNQIEVDENKYKEIKTGLSSIEADTQIYTTMRNDLGDEILELEGKKKEEIDKYNRIRDGLHASLQAEREQREASQKRIDVLNANAVQETKALEMFIQNNRDKLETEKEQAKGDIKAIREGLVKMREDAIEELKKMDNLVKGYKDVLNTLGLRETALKTNINILEGTEEQLSKQEIDKIDKISRLTEEKNKTREELKSLVREKNRLKAEIENRNTKVEGYKTTYTKWKKGIDTLRETHKNKEEELKGLDESKNRINDDIIQLTTEKQVLEEEKQAIIQEKQAIIQEKLTLEGEKQGLEEEKQRLVEEKLTLETELTELRRITEETTRDNTTLVNEMRQNTLQKEALDREVEGLRGRIENTTGLLEEGINLLEQKLDTWLEFTQTIHDAVVPFVEDEVIPPIPQQDDLFDVEGQLEVVRRRLETEPLPTYCVSIEPFFRRLDVSVLKTAPLLEETYILEPHLLNGIRAILPEGRVETEFMLGDVDQYNADFINNNERVVEVSMGEHFQYFTSALTNNVFRFLLQLDWTSRMYKGDSSYLHVPVPERMTYKPFYIPEKLPVIDGNSPIESLSGFLILKRYVGMFIHLLSMTNVPPPVEYAYTICFRLNVLLVYIGSKKSVMRDWVKRAYDVVFPYIIKSNHDMNYRYVVTHWGVKVEQMNDYVTYLIKSNNV